MNEGILEIMHQMASDEKFRQQLMINPREALAERGLSPDLYDALAKLAPVLVGVAVAGVTLGAEPPSTQPVVGWAH